MELTVSLADPTKRVELFGSGDRNLRRISQALRVRINTRSAAVRILGEAADVAKAAAVIERLQNLLRGRDDLDPQAVEEALADVEQPDDSGGPGSRLSVYSRPQGLIGRTPGQQAYIDAMLSHDCVLCVGPAGTGKTYLAVAVAVHLLKRGEIKRICLVRPAVEAGEKLGFLPGDLQAKVNPYLRPLFDAMHDMMSYEQMKRFMVNDIVEVIPLAYMRGRTLNESIIILDEAQNATPTQMLMFLTRLGNKSRMIVTGDDSQVDLDPHQPSGLTDAVYRLSGVPGIAVVRLEKSDIVRHSLVQAIVERYGPNADDDLGVGGRGPGVQSRSVAGAPAADSRGHSGGAPPADRTGE